MTGAAEARAGANFALIKYWGKADARLNVPAVGSISITLDAICGVHTSRKPAFTLIVLPAWLKVFGGEAQGSA